MSNDTIAAIATAPGRAGISIIRISGPEAFRTADRIFVSGNGKAGCADFADHTIHYGWIADNGEYLDEVLLLFMKAPKTYTCEDVIEIDCHGGPVVTERILDTVIRHGARLAEPGEFTRRAFLNGRIDLSEAEAVMDLIDAKTRYAARSSVEQLRGGLADRIRKLREMLLHDSAEIEAALDDPEHMSLEGFSDRLSVRVAEEKKEIRALLAHGDEGRMRKEGIRTVIVGKPNAGKSSLLNVLLGEERAIVTSVPGTTRDTLEESLTIGGICLNIVDTAGIHETDDIVEKIGVAKAEGAAQKADLIIYVVDGSRPMDQDDRRIIGLLENRKAIVLCSKSDLPPAVSKEEVEEACGREVIFVSAKEERGLDDLASKIRQMFFNGEIEENDPVSVTNLRHREALRAADAALDQVTKSIRNGMSEEFYSVDLMQAYEELGKILGEEVGEDLIDKIFREFCMGK